ncbi:MAG: hypothetical protein SGPRY_009707, partial [Prymnesium sp.]
MHAAAYTLDPGYLWSDRDKDEATQEMFLTVVDRLCLWFELKAAPGFATEQRELSINSPAVVARIARCHMQYATVREQDSIFSKPYVMQNAKEMMLSVWCSAYCSHFPYIQRIVIAVLKQLAAAGAAERNSSVYGMIKDDRRVRMQHDVADKRVYCHETLHYLTKLQDPLYSQSIKEWSDSDSE